MEWGELKKKGGFKGKLRKPKFTRTVKTGAQQKRSYVVIAPSIEGGNPAREQAIDVADVPGPLQRKSRIASRNWKRTKSVLENEVRREKRENDRVIKKNKVIGKALERSKINVARQGKKVISLSDTVREARQRGRESPLL